MRKLFVILLCLCFVVISGCTEFDIENNSHKDIEVMLPSGSTQNGSLPDSIDKDDVGVEVPKPIVKNFVGSKTTKKVHLTSCTWAQKINDDNKVYYSSYNEFLENGYIACKSCNP